MTGDDGQRVRIICIPRFSETGEIVLVNLSTLESEVIKFSSGAMKKDVDEEASENADVVMDDIEEL
jgi:DNA polymerase delta subunit 2